MRGATQAASGAVTFECFNPRAPCGARRAGAGGHSAPHRFQSTRPMRGATYKELEIDLDGLFQSTRPMRGATTNSISRAGDGGVSIHAPHAGRDPKLSHCLTSFHGFNPRAPCGARPISILDSYCEREFQSTRPMRGATFLWYQRLYGELFQSTRPMRGATIRLFIFSESVRVSIHAPHAGRDGKRGHDFPPLPRIYGYSPPQIRFSRHLRPTPLLQHGSRTYIFTFCFLFTSPSHSVMNAQMMMAASKS